MKLWLCLIALIIPLKAWGSPVVVEVRSEGSTDEEALYLQDELTSVGMKIQSSTGTKIDFVVVLIAMTDQRLGFDILQAVPTSPNDELIRSIVDANPRQGALRVVEFILGLTRTSEVLSNLIDTRTAPRLGQSVKQDSLPTRHVQDTTHSRFSMSGGFGIAALQGARGVENQLHLEWTTWFSKRWSLGAQLVFGQSRTLSQEELGSIDNTNSSLALAIKRIPAFSDAFELGAGFAVARVHVFGKVDEDSMIAANNLRTWRYGPQLRAGLRTPISRRWTALFRISIQALFPSISVQNNSFAMEDPEFSNALGVLSVNGSFGMEFRL